MGSVTKRLANPNFSLPVTLTTDASKIAVAAVLSQVQDGIERPIAYASRQMNKVQQVCSASEAEMLAFVWATKYFRRYLYDRLFLGRIDHSALSRLRNFADRNHRLMRWNLKLSELDFTVEHKAGAKIAVDGLSRNVGAIMKEGNMNSEIVLREEAKSEFCLKQKPGTYSGKQDFLDMKVSCTGTKPKTVIHW